MTSCMRTPHQISHCGHVTAGASLCAHHGKVEGFVSEEAQ